jgi:cysteinyl-tRNA synthetase
MLQFTNTLTGKKEAFTPLHAPQVRMYVCGLTPYEEAHIGHARAYVAYDVMRRYLEHRGFQVKHVQNVTDVDDRIIAKAHERKMEPLKYAAEIHEKSVLAFDKLRIRRAHAYPKVSEHIPGIVEMTQTLIRKGHAYAAQDEHGTSVYYSVESDPDYGKLSHLNREELLQGVRKDVAEGKRNAADFALWKASKPNESIAWDSPWGRGRPGWHIECSVMAKALLGETIDIHGGGWDLIFPHHENELAQSESANGQPFVRYWLHAGFLTVEGVKMSKSLGNFTTVNAALAEWKPEAVRLWFAGTHYRSPIDYSLAALGQADKSVERFTNMLANAKHALATAARKDANDADRKLLAQMAERVKAFEAAMDDDLNTPVALSVLFEMVGDVNRHLADPHAATLKSALDTFHQVAGIFDVLPDEAPVEANDAAPLLDLLMEVRQMARARKDFAASDRIRDRLLELGYVIEDAAGGARWRRKS